MNHATGHKTACSEAVHSVIAEPQPNYIGPHNGHAKVANENIFCAPSDQSKDISKREKLTWWI